MIEYRKKICAITIEKFWFKILIVISIKTILNAYALKAGNKSQPEDTVSQNRIRELKPKQQEWEIVNNTLVLQIINQPVRIQRVVLLFLIFLPYLQ